MTVIKKNRCCTPPPIKLNELCISSVLKKF